MIDTRERLTEGLNRARVQLELRRSLPSLPIIVAGVVATLLGAAAIFSQLTPTLFKSTHDLRFAIDDAYGILPGVDEVRYRGVPAGTIKDIEREGTQIVLRVSMRKDFPVYEDVRAELRPGTPLNDMYLDIIDPGTKARGVLASGDIVPDTQTETNIKINDVLNTLRSTERTRLNQLLDNLGNGLADRGLALRAAVEELIPFVAEAGRIADELAQHERLTKRLVSNAGQLTTALGERDRELRTLVREGAATLGALQDGSADLDRTLRELPPTMSEIDASLTAVDGVLGAVDGAVTDLYPVADRLPAALSDLRELESVLGPAVDRLQSPVQRLVPLARSLRPVARDVSSSATALRARLPSLDKVTDSIAKCEDAIIGFFQWNASLSKFGDIRGPVPRGNVAFGISDGSAGTARRPAPNCAGGTTKRGGLPTRGDEG